VTSRAPPNGQRVQRREVRDPPGQRLRQRARLTVRHQFARDVQTVLRRKVSCIDRRRVLSENRMHGRVELRPWRRAAVRRRDEIGDGIESWVEDRQLQAHDHAAQRRESRHRVGRRVDLDVVVQVILNRPASVQSGERTVASL
jgi:hypothetical protein